MHAVVHDRFINLLIEQAIKFALKCGMHALIVFEPCKAVVTVTANYDFGRPANLSIYSPNPASDSQQVVGEYRYHAYEREQAILQLHNIKGFCTYYYIVVTLGNIIAVKLILVVFC